MPDRVEREIEEILARLDEGTPEPPNERKPVSILSARQHKKPATPAKPKRHYSNPLEKVNPAVLLFTGAGLVVGGLILSNVWGGLIWASIAGIVVFLSAFAWSFFRSPRATSGGDAQGYYWRDRYIAYDPPSSGAWSRIKRKLRGR